MAKRVNFESTTYEQRVQLFTTWEMVGNVSVACRQTGISRGTFYYWKARFLKEGYASLEEKEPRPSRACYCDVSPDAISLDVQLKIIATKKQYPDWNIARIAQTVHPEIAPSLVRMVLLQADLWSY